MIVVTGGAGFIGSLICAKLQDAGFNDIVVIDWLGCEERKILICNFRHA